MNIREFLSALQEKDIQVWADGDKLRCNAAAGAVTPELREQLKQYKNEILEFISAAAATTQRQRAIVPLQPRGSRTPVFAVAGHNGDVFCYRTLVQHLGTDQPFFALQPPGLDGKTEPLARVEDIATYFADQIWAAHTNGPYIIAGYCAGGSIAFELARELQGRGGIVHFVTMFGCPYPTFYKFLTVRSWARRAVRHVREFAGLRSLTAKREYVVEKVTNLRKTVQDHAAPEGEDSVDAMRARLERMTIAAASRYTPGLFKGRLKLIFPNKRWVHSACAPFRWRPWALQVEEYAGPDDCILDEMLLGDNAAAIARLFNQAAEESSAAAVQSGPGLAGYEPEAAFR